MTSDDPRLPPAPDFAKLDEGADAAADQRAQIMMAVGNLVFSWSNNESVFIYVLMELLDADFASAATTFISLNTTRARLDLIRRLAKLKISDRAVLRRLERLIERFNDCTKVRNEFNHCIYKVNENGEITHTTTLRVTENKDGVKIAETKPIDIPRIEEIGRTVRKLSTLNRDLWRYLPELAASLAKARQAPRSQSGE